ncbi:MAG: serine/threonine protein kinase [Spirochaetales bacterium]|nr:serine/threonine protein kinase [Spirochaetales bacterium]
MSDFFYSLTPDVIVRALEQAGFRPSGYVMALNSFENRVFDLRLDDDSHVVAKFYRPGRWSREQIGEEHAFLLELAADEIPVCAPLTLSNGGTLDRIEGIVFAVWPRTGGRAPDELDDETLASVGRLVARIHNRGAAGEAPHRLALTGQAYGIEPLASLESRGALPEGLAPRFRAAVEEIVRVYEDRRRGVPFHRIHGDCHLGNLLRGSGGLYFLDFDDFLAGPAVQDVWMLCPARDEEGLRQRSVLLEGYRQFRDFDDAWLSLVEPLRGLRYVHYAAWLARRWEDPAFPRAFPHFADKTYWEETLADLEDQVDVIRGADAPPADPGDAEPPLTNKDYFWDWEE